MGENSVPPVPPHENGHSDNHEEPSDEEMIAEGEDEFDDMSPEGKQTPKHCAAIEESLLQNSKSSTHRWTRSIRHWTRSSSRTTQFTRSYSNCCRTIARFGSNFSKTTQTSQRVTQIARMESNEFIPREIIVLECKPCVGFNTVIIYFVLLQ